MAEGADERLIVMLEARISEFERRMGQAERRGTRTYQGLQSSSARATRQMQADMVAASGRINQALASVHSQIGGFAKAFIGGLAIGALNGIAGAARSAVADMADLADVADRVGIDVESYQGLQQGLKLAGVEANEAAGAMQAFTDRLGDAATGEGKLAEILAKSGIALTDRTGAMRDTLDILRDYADAVRGAPDASAKMALVTEAFGKGGKAMVLAMAEGSAGIDGMIDAARAAGTVIDEDMIRKAAKLDDEFDKVSQRIDSMFKSGVVAAAEFFGIFDRLDDLIPQGAAENMLGAELATALAENSTALEKSKEDLAELGFLYDQLQQQVTVAASAISNEIPYMLEIGADELALELSGITGEMDLLIAKTKEGKAPASELEAEMSRLIDRAKVALTEANKIDGVNLDNAVAAVGRVSGALQSAVDWAGQLLASMNAAAGIVVDQPMGGGMEEDARGRRIAPDRPLVGRSARPRRAPAMLGEGGAAGGTGGTGGGGGGGSGAIDALLAELATEREIIGAWYAESLQVLNGATDAQLAALGGRHEAIERLETEHRGRLGQIRDMTDASALSKAGTFFGALATVTAAGGDRLAKISRTFAAAEALINTYRAQAQVLADPRLGFWAKLPAVAAIGAAGLSLVSSLGGSGKARGGAGVAGAGAGADNAPSGAGGASEPVTMRFLVQGLDPAKLYTGKALVDLVSAIQGEMKNRGVVWEFAQ